MSSEPIVSIGIPNFNYSQYITFTLESVVSQEYANLELIIVDDCSTDDSVKVIEDWIGHYAGCIKIRFIKNDQNMGLTKVCNLLLANASGKYFQPLDADDILLPGKLAKQVAVLETNRQAAFVYSNALVINDAGKTGETDYLSRINYDCSDMPSGMIKYDLLKFNFVSLPTVLLRTDLVREVGGFNENLQVQDYYMWLKLSEKYEGMYMNEYTAKYRVHSNSMGNHINTNTRSEDSVLKIKLPYYHSSSNSIKQIIATNIQNSSVYLYSHHYPTARKWLKLAFELRPGVKTLLYYIASQLGIPFSWIRMFKRI